MAKRKTRQQKIEEEKRALQQRIVDIATGAQGGLFDEHCFGNNDVEFPSQMGMKAFSRFLVAIGHTFGLSKEEGPGAYCLKYWNMDEYDTFDNLTNFLYENGVRA